VERLGTTKAVLLRTASCPELTGLLSEVYRQLLLAALPLLSAMAPNGPDFDKRPGVRAGNSMGPVDKGTKGFSEGTYQDDWDAWLSILTYSYVSATEISADSGVIDKIAENVLTEGDYSMIGGPFGINSNSAAQAVANTASGEDVPVPGARWAPGAENWEQVKFDPSIDHLRF